MSHKYNEIIMRIVSICIALFCTVSTVFGVLNECPSSKEEEYLKELEEIQRIENEESLNVYVRDPAAEQKVLWIDIKPWDEANSSFPNYDKNVNNTIKIVTDFYAENSGNKQIMHVTKDVYINERMTRENCNSYSGFCESAITVGIRAYRALDPFNEYDIRVLNFYRSCNCMRFAGLAVVGGRDSYINRNNPLVVAHEIGHNNGAHHAGFDTAEYGSRISVMGAYAGPPYGHFTVGAKVAFGWLEKQHVAVIDSNETIWLQSHDDINSTFQNDTIYAIRINTEYNGRYLWVSYRSKYVESEGVHLVWSKDRIEPLEENIFSHMTNVYGHSQQLDYTSGTYTLVDSVLKLRHYYSHDNKLLVHFEEQGDKKVKIKVHFLEDITPLEEMLVIKCGEMINVPAGTNMVKFIIDHPTAVKLSTFSCENYQQTNDDFIIIYDRYPIEHDLNPTKDLNVGPVFRTYLRCDGRQYTTTVLTDKYNRAGYKYKSFNRENYIYLKRNPEASLILNVQCESNVYYCSENHYKQGDSCISCPNNTVSSEGSIYPDNCHNKCDKLAVWTSNGFYEGLFVKHDTHYESFPTFIQYTQNGGYNIILKSHGFWGIVGSSAINRGWWSNIYGGKSISDHPAGVSFTQTSELTMFACACEEPNHYVDINTRECVRCPDGMVIEPGHITSQNCVPGTTPTDSPTKGPVIIPTSSPTSFPSKHPTESPTYYPTDSPTKSPVIIPTSSPTSFPSKHPTDSPTKSPTYYPSKFPSKFPTKQPTDNPTSTVFPSMKPTPVVTITPSESPTYQPTLFPTKNFEQFLKEKSAKHKTYYNANYTRIWGGVKPKHRTAHGKFLSSPGINIWRFYVNRLQSGEHAFFGIQSNYRYRNKFPAHFIDGSIGYRGSGEKWFRGKRTRFYGIKPSGIGTLHNKVRELITGDTVTMVYNTNQTSLEFLVNDISYGIAYDNIPSNETFHMEVTIGYNNRADISILGYEHFN